MGLVSVDLGRLGEKAVGILLCTTQEQWSRSRYEISTDLLRGLFWRDVVKSGTSARKGVVGCFAGEGLCRSNAGKEGWTPFLSRRNTRPQKKRHRDAEKKHGELENGPNLAAFCGGWIRLESWRRQGSGELS